MNEPTSRIIADESQDTQPEAVPAGFRLVEDLGVDGPVRQVLVEQTETARLVRLAMARHSERDLVAAARARHGLVHSAVVPLLGFGADEDWNWQVLEYVPGAGLEARLAAGERPLPETAAGLLARLLSALAAAQRLGLCHADLTPRHVLIPERNPGDVMLDGPFVPCDTLPSRSANGSGTGNDDSSPDIARYRPPEQRVDFRGNLFSLALVTIEAQLGRQDFLARLDLAGTPGSLNWSPAELTRHLPGVNPAEARWLETMLAADPQARPPGSAECLDGLLAARRRAAGKSRTNGRLLGVIAIAALLVGSQALALVGIGLLWQGLSRSRSGMTDPASPATNQAPRKTPVANRRLPVVAASQPLQWLSADEAAYRRARRLAARDPGKENASRRYRDFLTAFPRSAHAPTARNDLKRARAGFDEAAREALRRMIRARDAAEANGRWVDALAACERFPRHYARTEYGRAAAVEKRATLERAADVQFALERRARALALAERFAEALRLLERAGATGIEVLDERRTQLAAEIARQQRDRQAARERAAAAAVLRRIRDEMTALPQRVFTWARRGQFAAAFGHLDALLNDEHYRAHHDRIRMIRRDMDGIVRFRRRAQENLEALIGSEYTLRTVLKQTLTGQIVRVAGGKVWLRLTVSKTDPPTSDAQTTVRLNDLALETWLILGAQHRPDEDAAPFARANADAGLFLLSYSLNARARRYFRAAAAGITPAEQEHYQELAEDLK